ncbi:aminopeptidase N [Streptomyces sp. NPDC046161]|uniref:aminopeptidase N n=1 Tax=Streptomyces sp. NPDC046161 TaxID=3155132 RepID=UPI0033C8AFBB
MPGENLSRDEARERAELLTVDGYEVSLDLRSAVDEAEPADGPRTFRSVTTIRFRAATADGSTFADLIAPSVNTITLNGRALDPSAVFDGSRIALDGLATENVLVVDANCAYSRTGEGMHRFVDPEDGEVYLYTQYEPADARRVYANFEQPDLKAPYRFEVTAPEGWQVWSNGVEESREGLTRRFAETAPISTYITCVVAGPYHYVTDTYTRGDLTIPLGAMCRKGLAKHFDADDVFLVTKQGFDLFHELFDYPYPFGKYDQAFVPEYNLGAMENPGMVTFREEYIFRGKVTQASYERRANVILHEMAHMWFGDLVTMKWWDDLWLKESFADFMGSFGLVEATRFDQAWVTFANNRKAWAYRADQLPSTHPITADIPDLEAAKLNFDGITYAKGAAVLKQLVAYVGREAFLEGARRYFKANAYGNTTLDDLLSVLGEVSGRDMAEWSRAWLQTAGVNALAPEVTYGEDGRIGELAVVQEGDELRPHRVAVGLYRLEDGALVRYARTEADVAGARTAVAELAGQERPDLILVNDDDLTYCKIRFDEGSLATLRTHLGDVRDPLARALCWSALWNLTRDALMPARDFVSLVLAHSGRESDLGVLQMLHHQALTAVTHYAAPEWREQGGRVLSAVALQELRFSEPASEHQLIWARFFAAGATTEGDFQLLLGLLDGSAHIEGLEVDQELRWDFLLPLTAHGAVDEGVLAAELARDDTASGRRHHVRCLAARPSAAVKDQAWAAVVESDALSNALVEATIAGMQQSSQRALLAPYTERYFEAIERVWAERSIQIGMDVVKGLYPALQDSAATLEATDAWLAARESAPPALRRLVIESRDDLARALRAQACDAGAATGAAAVG